MNAKAIASGVIVSVCMWGVLAAIVVGWLVDDATVAAWLR